MGLDISKLHFPDNSIEAQVLERVMQTEHVDAEEALRHILRAHGEQQSPAQRMIGLFSSPEDAALMDDVMELVRESRETHTTRDIGL